MSNEGRIPREVHATCPICGSGADYPLSVLTNADAQTNISTDKVEQNLIRYRGELMCVDCRQNEINREQSEAAAERHADEEDFRAGAGFVRSIS